MKNKNESFLKLTNDEQVAQMRNFLHKHYKIFEDCADCKISHTFEIYTQAACNTSHTIQLLFEFEENSNTKIIISLNSHFRDDEITIKKLNNLKAK